jgi:predicted protein tyrosine phosphatase
MSAIIHVCPLARLNETVVTTGALHIVTMLKTPDRMQRPRHISPQNHLVLSMDDITTEMDGYTSPNEEHVTKLVEFVKTWNRSTPLVMHCLAGISRSTAGAFVVACALNPQRNEEAIAKAIREVSPIAMPNSMLVKIADGLLKRDGRMIKAIESMGTARPAPENEPFRLALE